MGEVLYMTIDNIEGKYFAVKRCVLMDVSGDLPVIYTPYIIFQYNYIISFGLFRILCEILCYWIQ